MCSSCQRQYNPIPFPRRPLRGCAIPDAMFCVETVACCWQYLWSGWGRGEAATTQPLSCWVRAAYDRVCLIRARVSNGELRPSPLPGVYAKSVSLSGRRRAYHSASKEDVVLPTLEFRVVRRVIARRGGGAATSWCLVFSLLIDFCSLCPPACSETLRGYLGLWCTLLVSLVFLP